jgi:hypothetical protein
MPRVGILIRIGVPDLVQVRDALMPPGAKTKLDDWGGGRAVPTLAVAKRIGRGDVVA